jgi:hypothetical protein
MGDGHVDEIYERSVRASFPEGSGLPQFFGDLDQTIDLRHHPVLLSISAATAPRPLSREVPSSRESLSNPCKQRDKLYTTGT